MSSQVTPPAFGELLTSTEVADRLRITTKTLRRLADDDVLPRIRIGRSIRFAAADVEELVQRQRRGHEASG